MAENISIITTPKKGLDESAWTIIAMGEPKNLLLSKVSTDFKDPLFQHNINFATLTTSKKEDEIVFYILEPTYHVRAVIYLNEHNPIKVDNLINIVANLKEYELKNVENLLESKLKNVESLTESVLKNVENLIKSELQNAASLNKSELQNSASLQKSELQNVASLQKSGLQNSASLQKSELQNSANLNKSELQNVASLNKSELQNVASIKKSGLQNSASLNKSELQNVASIKKSGLQNSASLQKSELQNVDTNYMRLSNNPICPDLKRTVGEYVLGSANHVNPFLLDFVVYSFALIQPDGSFEVYSQRQLKDLVALKALNPNLKVTMAIGGWAADGFSDAALTAESRFKFAREAQKWVSEYNLDGVDIDWEYPGSSAAGIKSRKEDKQNFTLLLEALRMVLGPNKLITVAGIAGDSYIKNVEIDKIAKFIDAFHVMTYDFTAGSSGTSAKKHQGNLYTSELSISNISADMYVRNLMDAGMPSEKILLGLAFYGRQGMSMTKTYDEIKRDYLNKNGYKVKFDNVAKVPYIIDPNGNFFLSFEDELSIYYKGEYIIENCLGGLFSWQSAFDQSNVLASAMNLSITNPPELETLLKSYYV